uniref:Uncharacterized protein n=1 Tax=Dunaliella tertiolecta TaxID=3047 RepID=A0A7S3R8J0_DUNTE
MDAGQLGPASAQTLLHIAEGESLEAVPSIQLAAIKRSLTPAQLIIMEHLSEARRVFRDDAIKHQNLRMMSCLNAAISGNTNRLQAYMGRGRDVSATDYDNRSALMLACRNNHEDAVEMLLKAGADTSTVDSMGHTALFEAVRMGNDGCISQMLKYNAKLGVEPRISGPFIFQAITSKDLECLRRLIRVGADLDCSDLDGRTPLFLAASEGLLEVVILLVEEANVTVDAVDSWGHTPEGDARLAGYHAVAQYLQVQGGGKQLLPASEGSLPARQAEEPSPQATEESPHWQSSKLGHAARSSHSYSQLTFGTSSRRFLQSGSRPSIDQKRQELRRSMRNRTVSVNGTGRSRLAPSSSGTRRRPTTPTPFQEQPLTIILTNPSGSASPRPMTPTAFEEQPPHISSDGLAGPTNNLSFRLRPASQLVEDTSFEKPDVLRPPGTSPAGWVTPDGANRPESGPGTEHAHPLPKVGSFLAETTGDNEAGESMVLPFVDPESGAAHKSGAAHCNPCYV